MFQTRSEETGIQRFPTMKAAVAHAEEDSTVWKISFGIKCADGSSERIRLVRFPPELHTWTYAPITDLLDEMFRKEESSKGR